MALIEMELPSRTVAVEVWGDVGNGEDSGVEVVRAASCGSSVLSGYSETEIASECGSETYKLRSMIRSGSQDISETCSESSSTHESQPFGKVKPAVPAKKPNLTDAQRSRDPRSRLSLSARSETKPKVPAKPTVVKASSRPKKTETPRSSDGDGRWPFTSSRSSRSRATSAADPGRKSGPSSLQTPPKNSQPLTAAAINKALHSSMTQSMVAMSLNDSGASALEKYGTLPRRQKKKISPDTSPGVGDVWKRSESVGGVIASWAIIHAKRKLSFGNQPLTAAAINKALHSSMTQSMVAMSLNDSGASALEKYGTLPRRQKKKISPDGSPGSREPSVNRAATLRRQQSREKEPVTQKTLPPYPRGRKPATKTIILHEVSVQTALTGSDLESTVPPKPTGHTISQSAQTEERQELNVEEMNRLKKERMDALLCIRRVLGLDATSDVNMQLLKDLELHLATVARTILKQKEELQDLRQYKFTVQQDLERSMAEQKAILDQQKAIEAEQAELNDFLQAEKSTLSESLIDADDEISRLKEALSAKDIELAEQQEQCKHLVRLCEQRRQENLSLDARLIGLDQRNRDVLRQQGAAVSGAAVALTSLGSRLDNLVDQLTVSYHVAEKDLEDVIFHNEAYSQSPDPSPELPLDLTEGATSDAPGKPRQRAASFLSAVLGAIRSATQSPIPSSTQSVRRSSAPVTSPDQSSESLGLLDSEMDPSLLLDPLSKSSESGEDGDSVPIRSTSLRNLSAAILSRQRTEEAEAHRSLEPSVPPELSSLVDQVIHVDNLITKLLKVMRIVQMDNDACLDQLTDQRIDLDERLRLEAMLRQENEDRMRKVEKELSDARHCLSSKIQQLEEAKHILTENWRRESERQYATIDQALETLQAMQDVVDQFPALSKLQQQLEDCNFRTASGDDLNANAPNGHTNGGELTNGSSIRTTAI